MKLTATLEFIKEERGEEGPYNLRQFNVLETSSVISLGNGQKRMVKAFNVSNSDYYILKLELDAATQDYVENSCDACTWTFSIFQNQHDPEIIKMEECISCYPQLQLVISNENGNHTVYGLNNKIIIEEVRKQLYLVKLAIRNHGLRCYRHGEGQLRETVWLETKFDNCLGDHGHTFVPIVIVN
jgi:hypothetical protein